jgi:Pyruvate/2-oxoacid:ferredoxin oxidoreductase gamma subunit
VGSGLVPFEYDDIKSVVESVSRPKNLEMNLKAFEIGYLESKS